MIRSNTPAQRKPMNFFSIVISFFLLVQGVQLAIVELLELKYPGIWTVRNDRDEYEGDGIRVEGDVLLSTRVFLDSVEANPNEAYDRFLIDQSFFIKTFVRDYSSNEISREIFSQLARTGMSYFFMTDILVKCQIENSEELFDRMVEEFPSILQKYFNERNEVFDRILAWMPGSFKFARKAMEASIDMTPLDSYVNFASIPTIDNENIAEKKDFIRFVVERGIWDVDAVVPRFGLTMLQSTLVSGPRCILIELRSEMANFLISLGADVDVGGPGAKSPRELAQEMGILLG